MKYLYTIIPFVLFSCVQNPKVEADSDQKDKSDSLSIIEKQIFLKDSLWKDSIKIADGMKGIANIDFGISSKEFGKRKKALWKQIDEIKKNGKIYNSIFYHIDDIQGYFTQDGKLYQITLVNNFYYDDNYSMESNANFISSIFSNYRKALREKYNVYELDVLGNRKFTKDIRQIGETDAEVYLNIIYLPLYEEQAKIESEKMEKMKKEWEIESEALKEKEQSLL